MMSSRNSVLTGATGRRPPAGPGQITGVARLALLISLMIVWGCTAAKASAATVRVCAHGCAYSGIGAAVTAAAPGDRVLVSAGTYAGGFTIATDLTLTGAGSGATVIRGGGPVITVGEAGASTEPTVSISGVTITGGISRTSFLGGLHGLGGGVLVPPGATVGPDGAYAPGATLTIDRSVISGNAAAPESSVEAGFSCGAAQCRFAHAGGGGIDSWGEVTVRNSVVSGNTAAGSLTSDADGAGIYAQQGSLVVDHTVVRDNRATAIAPNGRFAEGAGIMFDTFFSPGHTCQAPLPACHLTIRDSVVTVNTSSLRNDLPAFGDGQLINMGTNAGGIHVGDGIPTTVQGTRIDGNSATTSDPQGEPGAIDAGMIVGDSPLTMSDSHVDGNQTRLDALSTIDPGPSGSALELDGGGTIDTTSISHNRTSVTAPDGDAGANGALAVLNFNNDPSLVTVRRSEIDDNLVIARSSTGTAEAQGAGVFNNSLLAMHDVLVSANTGRAIAPSGVAQGGGIWNGVDLSGPDVKLTLDHSALLGNRIAASAGITPEGGGLYTTTAVTLTATRIADNIPDQCVGCAPAMQTAMRRARTGRSPTRRRGGSPRPRVF